MPYINAKIIFPLMVLAAIIILQLANANYFKGLFNVSESNASSNVSSIIFWIVMIILSITAFAKNLSLIPLLGLSTCLYLLTGMTGNNWAWFSSWLVVGLIVYFSYGYRKSRLAVA